MIDIFLVRRRRITNTAFYSGVAWIIVLSFLSPMLFPLVYAQEATSTNFSVRTSIIGQSGGISTSTTYEQIGAAGDVAFGEASSATFILQSGPLYLSAYAPSIQNWRWYDDEDSITPTSAMATENTAPTGVDPQQAVKLRVTVKELGGVAGTAVKFKLQFSESSTFASGVTAVATVATCTPSSQWCYADGAGDDNATTTAKVLSDADACSGGSGDGCGSHNESPTAGGDFVHLANAAAEYEFTIKNAGAGQDRVFYFRLYELASDAPVPLASGASYPSMRSNGSTLTFTVDGLASGVSAAATTTTFTTTASAVSFGELATTTQAIGAQRLTVTTNANFGYTVYVAEREQMKHDTYAEVTFGKVSGTNASPTLFAIPGGETSAYGYRTSDTSLGAGTATRFNTANLFAQLDTTPREVAYASGPAASDTIDIVYKLQVDDLQEAGQYSGTVFYIATPVF